MAMIMSTKQKLTLMLFALVLSVTAVAQETIFPAEFPAPAEFNTGKVHISVLSRSEHQMTTNFLFECGSRNSWHYHPGATQVLMVLNGEAYYNVYSIDGKKILTNAPSLEGLPQGTYIVNGMKRIVR